jgi:threonine dehydratase
MNVAVISGGNIDPKLLAEIRSKMKLQRSEVRLKR